MINRYFWLAISLVCCSIITNSTSASATTSSQIDLLSSNEVALLAQQEGISTAKAEQDLRQQQQAGNIVGALQKSLGKDYAGVWFDLKTDQFHIGIAPHASQSTAEEVTNRVDITGNSDFESVSYTWSEIEHAQDGLSSKFSSLAQKQQVAIVADPRTDSVKIQVAANLSPSSVEQTKTAASTNSVKTEVTPVPQDELKIRADTCTFPFCNLPLRGGIPLISSANSKGEYTVCTAGFFVRDERNYPYLLTAGHCFYPAGSTWYNDEWGTAYPPHGETGCAMGHRIASALNSEADAGVVATEGCEPPEPNSGIVAWNSNENYAINGTPYSAYTGLFECHMGEHSGNQCGDVEYPNVTTEINYSGEGAGYIYLQHTDQVCALSLPGDSGGPWAAGGYGTAIDVAGNGKNCSEGGLSVGYELSYALSYIHVHIA